MSTPVILADRFPSSTCDTPTSTCHVIIARAELGERPQVTVSGKPSDDLHPKTRDSIPRQAGLNEDGSQADAREG